LRVLLDLLRGDRSLQQPDEHQCFVEARRNPAARQATAVEHEAGVPSATMTLGKRSAKQGTNAQCVVA
jgi:hypothetical protein